MKTIFTIRFLYISLLSVFIGFSIFNLFIQDEEGFIIALILMVYGVPFLIYQIWILLFERNINKITINKLHLENELLRLKSNKEVKKSFRSYFRKLKFIREFYFITIGLLSLSFLLMITYIIFENDKSKIKYYDSEEYNIMNILFFVLIVYLPTIIFFLLTKNLRKRDVFIDEISSLEKEIETQSNLNLIDSLTNEINNLKH